MTGIINKKSQEIKVEGLDQEWVNLIAEALESGLSKEEIRLFLRGSHTKGG